MSKPKILYFVTEGAFFCSHRLPVARAAKKAGYDIVVVANFTNLPTELLAEEFKIIPLKMLRRSINPLREAAVIIKLLRILQQEKPDIMHNISVKSVLLGTIAARLAGIKNIINAFTGLGYVYSSATLKAKTLRALITPFFAALFRKNTICAIFQNQEDRNYFIQRKILQENQTHLIYGSGVNINKFIATPEPAGNINIIYVGRLLWDKGVGDFVAAAQAILKSRHDIIFKLIGEPDPHNPSSIPLAKLQEWQQSGIHWLGKKTDIATIMQNAHVIVFPSAYGEGVPKVLLEAAASARPIITTDVAGCRAVVRDNVNGIIVPKKDVAALQAAILKLADHVDLRARYGLAGREIAVKEFSEEKVASETLAVYKKLFAPS